VVLSIGHTLRAHEALGCPDAPGSLGFLEVVHRLFEDGVFVGQPTTSFAEQAGARLRSAPYLCRTAVGE
jgi:hypothetical protein